MKALLAILIFFALTEPAAACRRFSIWHYNFPQPLPDRSPGGSSRACAGCAGLPLARPDRDHLGRNRRRAARCDRETAGLERRSLALRLWLAVRGLEGAPPAGKIEARGGKERL